MLLCLLIFIVILMTLRGMQEVLGSITRSADAALLHLKARLRLVRRQGLLSFRDSGSAWGRAAEMF